MIGWFCKICDRFVACVSRLDDTKCRCGRWYGDK